MEKQEHEPELDHTNPNPNPNPTLNIPSPPREPELEPMSLSPNPPSETIPPRREPELQPISLSPNPSPEIVSPRPESEFDHTSQNPPSKTHSPPLEPQPSDFSPLEEEENHKQLPVKPQTIPVVCEVPTVATKVKPTSSEVDRGERARSNIGSGRRSLRHNLTILKRAKRDNMIKTSLLGFRVCGFFFSLVSFSVLAADKDRGWALDSFYRYKEFRYCMAVNVIAFVYSGFQSYDLAYQFAAGKRKLRQNLRYYLDFSVDQILTYLLLSASSSAAVRVDDWQSNWGKDEFPDMAKASVAFSFLAFVALGICSLISGYALYTLKSM